VVKVDNTPRAAAVQEGIDKADLVWVEQVEAGVTRMAVTFHSQEATVGPIRSARTSDLGITANLDKPLFVYSGANGGVLREVRSCPCLVDTGIDSPGMSAVFKRNQRGSGLERYFLPTAEVWGARQGQGGTPQPLFEYRGPLEASIGVPGRGAQVIYGGKASTKVSYEWDGKGFLRSQFGGPHVMANNGPRLAPQNVVFLAVRYRPSGYVDTTGAQSPEAVIEGTGVMWVLSDGKLARGTWSRVGDGRLTILNESGQPFRLTPGQTFIELAPDERAIAAI
jgi:hypothetical protein